MPPIEFLVDRRDGGQTIASVLRKRFNLPWSRVKRIIEGGHVRVAGFACSDPGRRVKAKNRVWIREGMLEVEKPPRSREAKPSAPKPPAKREPKPVPVAEKLPLNADAILYFDDALVVVNKPAGLTTMRHVEEANEFGPRGKHFLPKTLADFLPRLLGAPTSA